MQFYFDDNLEMKVHLIIMKTFSTIKKCYGFQHHGKNNKSSINIA